jgi:hypothetical protein
MEMIDLEKKLIANKRQRENSKWVGDLSSKTP